MKSLKKLSALLAAVAVAVVMFIVNAAAYAPGDVNNDGDVLANDARLALRASARLEVLDPEAAEAADVNRDGNILADDARQILRYSARLVTEFATVYQEPASEEPSSEEPVSEEPSSEEPSSEESVSEEPSSEEPSSEEPVSEEPVSEEPSSEEPVSEEPSSEEPSSEDPGPAYEVPRDVKALLAGKFGFEGQMYNDGSYTEASVYTDGKNIRMSTDGKELGISGEIVLIARDEEQKILGIPTGRTVRKAYMLDPAKRVYLDLDELSAIGVSPDDFSLSFNLDTFGGENAQPSSAEFKTVAAKQYLVYTFDSATDSRRVKCYTADGALKIVEFLDGENITSRIVMNSFTAYPDDTYFQIPREYRRQLAAEFVISLLGEIADT